MRQLDRRAIRENVRLHDAVAPLYDDRHPEIFNFTEQRRLERQLDEVTALVRAPHRRALDVGCGTGNLTGKLLARGFQVAAADVSGKMLGEVRRRLERDVARGQLSTVLLSGDSLLPFRDGQFALVCAYSVLHHIPDYLLAVREMARILDAGGVLYIDHELNEDHWRSPLGIRINRLLTLPGYSLGRVWARARRLWGHSDPPLPPPGERAIAEEGDIHIFADDHVEWNEIRAICGAAGLVEHPTRSYLLCREHSRFPVRYWICRAFAADMQMYVGQRPADPALRLA